jgi:hypothetical protein
MKEERWPGGAWKIRDSVWHIHKGASRYQAIKKRLMILTWKVLDREAEEMLAYWLARVEVHPEMVYAAEMSE